MTNSQPVAAPSVLPHFPWGTLLLSTATVVLSAFVAIEISGTWMGKVRIVDLEQYGVRFEHVQNLELWRLVTAQLVHVKQLHMVADVFCLLWVGTAIEKHVGGIRLLLLWLIGGSLATLFSTLFVTPPWNLGTGASQAIMAIAGTGLWLAIEGVDRSRSLMLPVAFSIGLAFAIDIVHVYHPKPGHVAGLLLGLLAAMLHKRKAETSP
ncbi:MAG: rhomboid family intramembrane serine protease [Aquimonas sp.]|jgi:rhomboid protease GluP|nr:rhomboid family intramembrane serine protease [Aquimonas sp.]